MLSFYMLYVAGVLFLLLDVSAGWITADLPNWFDYSTDEMCKVFTVASRRC